MCASLRVELHVAGGSTRDRRGEFAYHGRADLLLSEAEWFSPATGAAELGAEGHCYTNARDLASSVETLMYAEGVAVIEGLEALPIDHAWCVDRNTGGVVESTWTSPGSAYLGFVIGSEWHCRFPGAVLDAAQGMGKSLCVDGLPEGWAVRGFGTRGNCTA